MNDGGSVLGSGTVDAFGNMTTTDGTGDPYGGFGAQWGYYDDAQTQLYLLGQRYYDSAQGRFLTRDPSEYEGGINLYGYTLNNAVNLFDDDGTKPVRGPIDPNRGHDDQGNGKKNHDKHTRPRSGDRNNTRLGDWYDKTHPKHATQPGTGRNRGPKPCPDPGPQPGGYDPVRDDQPIKDITGDTFLPWFFPWGKISGPIRGLGPIFGHPPVRLPPVRLPLPVHG